MPISAQRYGALLALVLPVAATAAPDELFTFTVLPNPPPAKQDFQIRVGLNPPSCVMLPEAITATALAANVIRYDVPVPDYCILPQPIQGKTYTVPSLPAGQYRFRFALCMNAVPPGDPCTVFNEQTILVGGVPQPDVVALLSPLALSLLIGLTTAIGGVALRRA